MGEAIIKSEGLSKRYILGAFGAATFREELSGLVARFIRGTEVARRRVPLRDREFWALRDISFEINEGDTVGLIGRNGAGKSTLLKILSRITVPTSGRAVMNGKVAALLEVGTGFHPDLTGIENIYLNGAILGMRRWEIRSRLESILEFSGVQSFADTPVKRYSSGMRVRLAFAVAAHLRQDILIVDEVLAVGDHEFQRKCLGKMGEVAKQGRTVIFVSHNMFSVSQLCERCMYLKDGQLAAMGPTHEIISDYLKDSMGTEGVVRWENGFADAGVKGFRVHSIALIDWQGKISNKFSVSDPIRMQIEFESEREIWAYHIRVNVVSDQGISVLSMENHEDPAFNRSLKPGRYIYEIVIPPMRVNQGSYSLSFRGVARNSEYLFRIDDVLGLDVELISRNREVLYSSSGVLYPEVVWECKRVP